MHKVLLIDEYLPGPHSTRLRTYFRHWQTLCDITVVHTWEQFCALREGSVEGYDLIIISPSFTLRRMTWHPVLVDFKRQAPDAIIIVVSGQVQFGNMHRMTDIHRVDKEWHIPALLDKLLGTTT